MWPPAWDDMIPFPTRSTGVVLILERAVGSGI